MCSATDVSISPVAMGVSKVCDRSAWPTWSHASRGSSIQTRSNCSSSRHIRRARARSHCWLASTMKGAVAEVLAERGDAAQVLAPVGLADLDLDAADAGLEGGGGLLLDLLDGGLEEAAGGVVDAARVAVRAEELGERQAGAAGLEVVERDVERGDRLRGDAGAADGGTGPHERLVDLGDVVGVLADGDVHDLLEVGVLPLAARALGVAEPHALEALLGGELDEEHHRLGERLLAAGEDLGVADRVGQRKHDVRQRDAADAVARGGGRGGRDKGLRHRGSSGHREQVRANLYDECATYYTSTSSPAREES